MNVIKSFSRRILLWSFIVMLLLAILFNASGYYGARLLLNALPIQVLQDASIHSDELKISLEKVLPVVNIVQKFYIPVVSAVFVIFALILWLILRGSIARFVRKSALVDQQVVAPKKKGGKDESSADTRAEPVITKKELMETNKRFYLHLLSVLQREGRLIDFFSEDLSIYEDAQIGAAVRSIQDNCKNSLKKYLNPKAVIDKNEGDPISVSVDFDPNTITLTGNVTGEPPFQGMLRHKGWRASRLELPTLSTVKDPSIIAPAEVEIM
ncbi:MAG: DUF2760 domain-containing protein [Desulfobacteraceae bacterium]|nr:DUF2760 domain-containing protein [Desulfobacteraceae bacterium]MBC2756495.1 DUF2760 domain-containing protein [Desulfobacteraceae bacterium]